MMTDYLDPTQLAAEIEKAKLIRALNQDRLDWRGRLDRLAEIEHEFVSRIGQANAGQPGLLADVMACARLLTAARKELE